MLPARWWAAGGSFKSVPQGLEAEPLVQRFLREMVEPGPFLDEQILFGIQVVVGRFFAQYIYTRP
jgi:hypothetical protein